MSRNSLRGAVEWALMVALVFGAGAVAQAQNDEKSDGNIVKIGHADGDQAKPNLPPPGEGLGVPGFPQQPPLPKYWIGLLGGTITADNPLRAHLDLPENQGLIVANIVPESPAAKAGLKQHDILLRANDKDLHEMSDLVDLVLSEGPKKGQITLEVMRHNKRETVYLTPEERPANAQMPQPQGGFGGAIGGGGGEFGIPNELLQQFGNRMPMEFRNFGPGVIVHGEGQGVANMPNGVSVNVQKEDGKPAHITVKRGEETWNVTGDDPESLKQLPEDLRPFVEQMLQGNGGMKMHMQNFEQRLGAPGAHDGQLRERLERMEQQMQELQKRLSGEDHPAADKANDQHEDQK
jgi:membrane-associated protease RseP (regulator of RpoE activity)